MSRIVAAVEGQTEQAFVREVLAPWLAQRDIFLTARLIGKPGRKGGVGEYDRAKRDFILLLKEQPNDSRVTTMFDFYRMPDSWPGRKEAKILPHNEKAISIESALSQDVAQSLGNNFNPNRFIPYVQMHEFEALLFSEPEILAGVASSSSLSAQKLRDVRNKFESPEHINDSPETAPSKVILSIIPRYAKVIHGSIAAQRMSITTIANSCVHFKNWLAQLTSLE
jgi:hypothetical protein